ncbi:hypothetical protein AB0P15_16580 [Streptomyces sp. NPDC087917]|uniref:hypothetical protein n=1 Tax=unclassified Streptomyces TaxID=2593676 RepID=UPI00342E0FA7
MPPYPLTAPAQPAGGSGTSHRGAWIGAGATMLAAVVTLAGVWLMAPDQAAKQPSTANGPLAPADPATKAAGAPNASGAAQAPATAAQPSAPTAPAAQAGGTLRWEGPLVLAYAEDRDLDSSPPVTSPTNAHNDFSLYDLAGPQLSPQRGTKALVWETEGAVPTYADCAAAVVTRATTATIELKAGMVLCAVTNEGRVARLRVKELSGSVISPQGVFQITVWNKA